MRQQQNDVFKNNMIDRSNIIESIIGTFNSRTNIIVLEGEDGSGKTEFVKQFNRRQINNSLLIMVNRLHPYSSDERFLVWDLVSQICLIANKRMPREEENHENLMPKYLNFLNHHLRSRNVRQFFILVDGFDQIPNEIADRIKHVIYTFFNLSVESVNYMFTGDASKLSRIFDKLDWQKSTRNVLNKFSFDETKKLLLSEIAPDEELFSLIFRISKGNPGTIWTILRLMKKKDGSFSPTELDQSISLESIYKIEYDLLKQRYNEIEDILAVLVFSEVNLKTEQLLGIIGLNQERLNEIVTFSELFHINDGIINLNSDSFARFLANNLKHLEQKAIRSIVSYSHLNPHDNTVKGSLVKCNHRLGNTSEVIKLLNPLFCEQMLADNRSYNSLIENIEIGLHNALSEDSFKDSLRFAMLKSLLTDRSGLRLYSLEMISRLALDDIEGALKIVYKAKAVEDRFKLLSLMASHLSKNNKNVPSEILIQIKELFSRVNFRLDNNLVELIGLALDFSLEISIKLIELLRESLNDDDVVDSIISEITIQKIESNSEHSLAGDPAFLAKITNPNLRTFIASLRKLPSFDDSEFMMLFDSSEELFSKVTLLRLWTRSAREGQHLFTLMNKSLDFIISHSELVINSSMLNDLTTPISLLNNPDEFMNLKKRIFNLFESVNTKRPSIDYIQLKTRFIENTAKFDCYNLENEYSEIIEFTHEIFDLPTRLEGYLIIINSFKKSLEYGCNDKFLWDTKKELLGLFFQDLEYGLVSSALHENLLKPLIKEIVRLEEKLVVRFYKVSIPFLTEYRAQFLIGLGLKEYLSMDDQQHSASILRYFLGHIKHQVEKERVVLSLLSFVQSNDNLQLDLLNIVQEFVEKVVQDSRDIQFLMNYYSLNSLIRNSEQPLKNSIFENEILNILDEVPCLYSQIVGDYQISQLFSDKMPETSLKLLKGVEEKERRLGESSFGTISLSIQLTSLLIRCLPGLETNGEISRLTREFVISQIERVPSDYFQLKLYIEMAERYYLAGKVDETALIVEQYIMKILDRYFGQKAFVDMFIISSCVIYVSNQARFESELAKINEPHKKTEIVQRAINFLIFKCSSEDNCELNKINHSFSYNAILQILGLIKLLEDDHRISSFLTPLLDNIADHKLDFTREQLNDIRTKVEEILTSKLPDYKNIKHDGYLILLRTRLARIVPKKNKYIIEDLRALNEKATGIPNTSDQVFVKCAILEAVGDVEKDENFIKALINEINQLIEEIPVFEEQMERLETFLEVLSEVDRSKCKAYLKKILGSFQNSEEAYLELQKKFIDLAYKVDKDLAEKLVSAYDDDPARKRISKSLKSHLHRIRTVADFENSKEIELEYLPGLSRFLLRKLNSGSFTPKSYKSLKHFIVQASKLPFNESFVVYEFIVQNLISKNKNSKEASAFFGDITRNLISSLKLVNLIERDFRLDVATSGRLAFEESSNVTIKPGERERFNQILINWFDKYEPQEIVLIDPYFEPKGVELLKMIKMHLPGSSLRVLTSFTKISDDIETLRDRFQSAWESICEEEAPDNLITFVIKKDYFGTPLHDRFIISTDTKSGLKFGTSFSALGGNKISSVDIMDETAVENTINEIIVPYLEKRILRTADNCRLEYPYLIIN